MGVKFGGEELDAFKLGLGERFDVFKLEYIEEMKQETVDHHTFKSEVGEGLAPPADKR